MQNSDIENFIKNNKKQLVSHFKKEIRKQVDTYKGDVDVLDILDDFNRKLNDSILDDLLPYLRKLDPEFLEDPNAIIKLPIINNPNSNQGKLKGDIHYEDLWMRSPLTQEQNNLLKTKTVGFSGMGAIQLGAQLLARTGVGNFVFVDPDRLETSNSNRQVFCYSDTLGEYKVEAAAKFLKKINIEINTKTYPIHVKNENLEDLFKDVDIIIDTTGDTAMRKKLHQFARKTNKPIISFFWGSWEGQVVAFMPKDPLYTDVFTYSAPPTEDFLYRPPNWNRTVDTIGLNVLSTLVARTALLILIGDKKNVVTYPNLFAVNFSRKCPVIVRNVIPMKKRNEKK